MIRRVYENASKSASLSELVVATDDERIAGEVRSFGGKVLLTSVDHPSGTSRCGEVTEKFPGFDIVINIQGDEPLLDPRQIDQLVDLFKNPDVKIGTLVKKIENSDDVFNPNRVKVVLDKEQNGIYFSRAPIPFVAGVEKDQWTNGRTFYKHIGIYAWRAETLKQLLLLPATELERSESLEQLRWIHHGYQIRTALTGIETPNIDVPADVTAVLAQLKK